MDETNDVFKNDVYLWLSNLTTVEPLLDQWKVPGYQDVDPVAELYSHEKEASSLWIWILTTMGVTLISMSVILLLGMGKLVKWEPSHGQNFSLFGIIRQLMVYAGDRCTIKLSTFFTSKDLHAYEKPVDVRLKEIHVYADNMRILSTLKSSQTELQEPAEYSKWGQASPSSSHISSQQNKASTPAMEQRFSLKKVDKTGTFFRKFSLRRSRLTQTVPYHNSKEREKRLAQIEALRVRPLPPLPTISDIMKEKEHSLFFPTHLFQEPAGNETSKRHTNFDKVRKRLLTNSQEQLSISFISHRKNILAEFHRHRSTLQHERKNTASQDIQSLRSKSFDDNYLSHKRRNKLLLRRSKSVDILEENVTINTLYSELYNLTHKSTPNVIDNNGYIQLPSDDDFVPKRHIDQEMKNKARTKVKRDESLYAKIPDLPNNISKTQIQKRPIPVPEELQVVSHQMNNMRISDNLTHEHIYQRASLIQAEKNHCYIKIANKT